ncbi:MAG: hypothetical protein V1690_00170 [Candidatus Moraniibacteriota bacterium]
MKVDSIPKGIKIQWTGESNSKSYILVRSETGLPQSASDGKVLYDGRGNSYIDTDIQPGKKYYYSVISVVETTVTQKVTKKIVEIVEQVPSGAKVGAVAIGAGSQAIGMLTLFDSLKDLWLTLIRVSQVVLAVMAVKKRNQWGVVYDWGSKEPLKNIPLNVVNERGERMEGAITDSTGRFGFLAGKGDYSIKVAGSKEYAFDPKQYQSYDIYGKVYTGDPIKIESDTSTILKLNIPLVKQITESKSSRNIISTLLKLIRIPKFLNPILEVLFWLGFIFIGVSLTQNPTWPSIILVSFYFLIILVRAIVYLNTRDFGLVLDAAKKTPLPFAVINAVKGENEEGDQLGVAVTNTSGNFYLLAPKEAKYVIIKGRTLEGRKFRTIKPISPGSEVIKGTYFV